MHLPCRIHSSASYSAPHGTRACKMLRPPALFLGMILLFGSGVSSLAAAKHQSTDVKASTAAISPQFSQPQSAPFGARLGDDGFAGPLDMSLALDNAGNTYVAAAGSCCANSSGWAIFGNPGWDSSGYIQKLAPDGSAAPWSLIIAGQVFRMVRDA